MGSNQGGGRKPRPDVVALCLIIITTPPPFDNAPQSTIQALMNGYFSGFS
ncbi:Protein of unknown function [Mycobacterium canettii CIPT 140070017]|nr:Protein of unknown function [Mycobacterium canettii CIPT 140070017]